MDPRVAWGIRYHGPLRFYADDAFGYEYPEMYNRIFGHDYVPEPYIKQGPTSTPAATAGTPRRG